MSAPAIDLPQAPRDRLYRAMEAIVRANPVFQRVCKPTSFRTWSGNVDDSREFVQQCSPGMRWTPTSGPEVFRTPEITSGPLYINCSIQILGSNVSDIHNFWWMLERCFFPDQPGTNTIALKLVAEGALSGLVFFTQPAFDQQPDGVWLMSSGQMRIDTRNEINS